MKEEERTRKGKKKEKMVKEEVQRPEKLREVTEVELEEEAEQLRALVAAIAAVWASVVVAKWEGSVMKEVMTPATKVADELEEVKKEEILEGLVEVWKAESFLNQQPLRLGRDEKRTDKKITTHVFHKIRYVDRYQIYLWKHLLVETAERAERAKAQIEEEESLWEM